MAVSDALAAAIDRFYKREYGEPFISRASSRIDLCCTDEVPSSRYTKEELFDLDIPECFWNKEFPLRVYLELPTMEITTELNGCVVERVAYPSEEAVIAQIDNLCFDRAVELNISDTRIAEIFNIQ